MPVPNQRMQFCTSRDGTRIAFAKCGGGPPLLWIGHWIRHLKFDWESPVWRPWLTFLTRRHSVVRYDWRGCGLSDRDGVGFSLEKHTEDLEAVVHATGLDRFVLFASAGGATMSMRFVARHPDRVSRLILYGPQTRGAIARGMNAQTALESHVHFKMVELGWNDDRPAYRQFLTMLHMPDADPDLVRQHDDLLRLTTSPSNTAALLQAFFEADVLDDIPKIRCPTWSFTPAETPLCRSMRGAALPRLFQALSLCPWRAETTCCWRMSPRGINLPLPLARSFPAGILKERVSTT
jgi:pimeloyl-ACP methyl ester carboxylesterase